MTESTGKMSCRDRVVRCTSSYSAEYWNQDRRQVDEFISLTFVEDAPEDAKLKSTITRDIHLTVPADENPFVTGCLYRLRIDPMDE